MTDGSAFEHQTDAGNSPPSAPASGPSVFRDWSFWGLTVAQFLGAFNDNLFKQLVLLICLDYSRAEGLKTDKYQPYAMLAFVLPWILMSGLAGFVSDRGSKQRGIVLFKALEVVITLAGMAAFLSNRLWPLLLVLFLLSTHSTFFGPSKYGILPQLFRSRDLPQINGVFQMTTFLAIIFGAASAGIARDRLPGQSGLAWISLISVLIAVAGTVASLFIKPVPAVRPGLPFTWSALGVDRENFRFIWSNRFLAGVLLVSSVFWFAGGFFVPAVNSFGTLDLKLSASRVSILQACPSLGIAVGCLLAGRLSKRRVRFGLVRCGAWGLVAGLLALTGLSVLFHGSGSAGGTTGMESPVSLILTATGYEWLARIILVELGASAGIFVVPLQVVLQAVPPEDQKGRMIATMNLANWFGILLSVAFYAGCEFFRSLANQTIAGGVPAGASFSALAAVVIFVAMLYRPADRELVD